MIKVCAQQDAAQDAQQDAADDAQQNADYQQDADQDQDDIQDASDYGSDDFGSATMAVTTSEYRAKWPPAAGARSGGRFRYERACAIKHVDISVRVMLSREGLRAFLCAGVARWKPWDKPDDGGGQCLAGVRREDFALRFVVSRRWRPRRCPLRQ